MTGAQTDKVRTKQYLPVVSLILRVAAPLFYLGVDVVTSVNNTPLAENAWENWRMLRRIAQQMLDSQSCELTPADREHMLLALRFAHAHSHLADGEFEPSATCGCATAQWIRDLTVLSMNAEGVPCAA